MTATFIIGGSLVRERIIGDNYKRKLSSFLRIAKHHMRTLQACGRGKYFMLDNGKIKGTVSRYCACSKLWFLDRMSRIQNDARTEIGTWKSCYILLSWVRFPCKPCHNCSLIIFGSLCGISIVDRGFICVFFNARWLADREEGSVLVPVEDFFPPPASLKARKIGGKPSTNGAKNTTEYI